MFVVCLFFCTFNLFKACINQFLVLTERQMEKKNLEGHRVGQTEVLQSQLSSVC